LKLIESFRVADIRPISAQPGVMMKGNVWEIVRKQDGSFDIFHKGELLHDSIPDQWLENQLGRYGFCGQEYKDIRFQLDLFGKARIDL
jgi:hypothetical protein